MNLSEFLRTRGQVNELAACIGVPPALLSQWKTGVRQVPAGRCPDIEAATGGEVRCEDLRSDINWGTLRNSDCPDREVSA